MTYNRELVREKFKDLFEYSLDLIFVNNFRGNFLDANDLALEKLGYKRGEISNINYKDLISKDQLSLAFKALMEIRDLGKQLTHTEYKLKTKNGEFLYVETYGIPLRQDGKIYGILGVARDITKQKLAEQKLKESEERLKNLNKVLEQRVIERTKELKQSQKRYKNLSDEMETIFDNIPALLFYKDTKNNYIRVNKDIADAHNLTKEELEGKSLFDLYSRDQAQAYWDDDLKVIKSGEPKLFIEEPWETDEGTKWVSTSKIPLKDEKGDIIGIIGMSLDITDRKRGEEELRIKDNAMNSSINAIAITDMQQNITYVNPSFLKMWKCSSEKEVLGKNILDFWYITKEDATKVFKKLQEMGSWIGEVTGKRKDGSFLDIQISTSIVKDSSGKPLRMMASFIDITKRKKMEGELKKSEEKYRLISENANDLIAVVNQKSKFEYINENVHIKILGFSKDDLIGKSTLEIIHPDDINNAIESFKKGFEHGELMDLVRLKDKNSIYHWLEVRGNRFTDQDGEMKILMIARDITERKKTEQKLKESEEEYRSILENIEEGYFELDLKGNYTFVNEYHSNFFGVPKDEMIGKNYADFVDKKYIKKLFKIFNQVYREEVPSARYEIKSTRYDGMKQVYEGTCNLKLNSNGKKIGFYSLTRDITERKKMEALKEKFTEQLKIDVDMKTKELQETIFQQKLYLEQIIKASQFKTEFMGSMSHELRTPLNAIIGFTDLLLESSYGPVNEDQFDFLKDIKSSGEHLLHMIDQILDISRIEAGELILRFQDFHLKSHIAQIKSSIQPLYEKKKIKFEIIGLDTNKYIYADPIRLKEIFYNLLTNAIKFTNKGKITLKILEKENQWEFQVIDTGIGIEKEDFDIIFKEFKRVESPEVIAILGSGLGLPITRKLVYMHGGTIDFTSEVGKGSTFIFTIPKNLDQKNQE